MGGSRCTRRDFLGATASLAIAPAAFSWNGGRRPLPSERVTLAHIGVGGRGTGVLRAFLALPEAQSVAVCDVFRSRRERAAKLVDEFYQKRDDKGAGRGCTAHGDFRELLRRDDIDGVVIATPDHWHVPMALMAVRAGKDVYVEKPLSVAVRWNQALREEVQKRKAVFQYGTQQRSDPKFRRACELVRSGAIGELKRIEAWCPGMAAAGWYEKTSRGGGSTKEIPVPPDLDYDMWLGPAPHSPYTKDRCTQWGAYHVYDNSVGFIAGWGVHPLDIAQWGNAADDTAPVEYEGTGTVPTEGLFDTVSEWDVHARWANGVTLRFMNTKTAAPVIKGYRKHMDHGTTFFGPEGWISVDRGGLYASDSALLKREPAPDAVRLYESRSQWGNFIDCVKSRGPTVNPVGTAVQDDLISHLSDLSIRLGRKLRWKPETEEVVGDEEAARLLHRPLRKPWRL